jgi:anti-anti-sigma factor
MSVIMLMITVETDPETVTFRLDGRLAGPGACELHQRVQALLRCGQRRILLDLSRLSDIDAAGIGELISALTTTSAAGGVLQIAHASGHVRQLLDTAGVFTLLTAGGLSTRAAHPGASESTPQ